MMDLFGSRDEDPLLQETFDSAADDASADPSSSNTPADAPPADESSRDPRSDAERTIQYSQEEAESGPLSDLNHAFDREWRLARVQLSKDGALRFTLQRGVNATDQSGPII